MKIYVVYCNESNEGGECSCSWRNAERFFQNEIDAIHYCQNWNYSENYPYEWEEKELE